MSVRALMTFAAMAGLMAVLGTSATLADSIYLSPLFDWSLTVPDDWTVDDGDSMSVAFVMPDGSGSVSVNVGEVRAANVDALAENLVGLMKEMAAERGFFYEVLAWRPDDLPDGTPFVEVEERVGEGDGGRTIMRMFLSGHTAAVVIGQAPEARWPGVSDTLISVVRSFHPGETTVLTSVNQGLLTLLRGRH